MNQNWVIIHIPTNKSNKKFVLIRIKNKITKLKIIVIFTLFYLCFYAE